MILGEASSQEVPHPVDRSTASATSTRELHVGPQALTSAHYFRPNTPGRSDSPANSDSDSDSDSCCSADTDVAVESRYAVPCDTYSGERGFPLTGSRSTAASLAGGSDPSNSNSESTSWNNGSLLPLLDSGTRLASDWPPST